MSWNNLVEYSISDIWDEIDTKLSNEDDANIKTSILMIFSYLKNLNVNRILEYNSVKIYYNIIMKELVLLNDILVKYELYSEYEKILESIFILFIDEIIEESIEEETFEVSENFSKLKKLLK